MHLDSQFGCRTVTEHGAKPKADIAGGVSLRSDCPLAAVAKMILGPRAGPCCIVLHLRLPLGLGKRAQHPSVVVPARMPTHQYANILHDRMRGRYTSVPSRFIMGGAA